SSILAYQGICGQDNLTVEPGDEKYFHAASYDEIQRYILVEIPDLRPAVPNGNNLPTIDAGSDFVIPASTPFVLTASGSDADVADVLTYTWDQIDLPNTAGQTVPIPNAADADGPLFRSYAPTTSATRTFPRMSDILANTDPATNRDEHLPTQSREMNFRVTVRDNHSVSAKTVSGIRSDDVKLDVVDTGAAFQVTSPNTAVMWTSGASQTVTWDVAGTTGNGIDTPTVNLRLSTDGGNSFPILLGNYLNNGSASIVVPQLGSTTTQARLKIEGAGNVFFDVSDADFTIAAAAQPGVTIIESEERTSVSERPDIAADTYQISLDSSPNGGADVTITVTADTQTEISTTGVAGSFTTELGLVFTDTTAQTIHVRAIDDLTIEGVHTSTISHAITASDDAVNYPLSLGIPTMAVQISDNDTTVPSSGSGQLVGVDFDGLQLNVPTNWATNFFVSYENMIDESGVATGIGLELSGFYGSGSTSTPSGSTVPVHSPSLSGLDGILFSSGNPYDIIWTGLTPGFEYDLYAFGLENFAGAFGQRVTIHGEGAPISFDQVLSNGTLLINDETGSSSRSLESYGERVTATEYGTIRVYVEVIPDSMGIALAGLAIEEVVPTTTIASIDASNLEKQERESGVSPFTFRVTRSGDVSSAATVDFAISGRDGNPADPNDFGGSFPSGTVQFSAGESVSDLVVLGVVADNNTEPSERFTVTLSNPSDGAALVVDSAVGTILPGASQKLSTIGLYQPDLSLFHLRDSLTTGVADQYFAFGPSGNAGWTPLSGDWNGDGIDTIGFYQPDLSVFHLKDSFTPGASDQYFAFGPSGNAGWIPLAGDWNGDGIDTVGLYQPDVSLFHLKDSFTPGASDQYFAFGPGGNAGWTPLVGDWDGDGVDTIGLYQPDLSLFHLKDSFTPGASDQYFAFGPGNAGWTPLTGDWNGNGSDTIGLYQPDSSIFHLKDTFEPGASDHFFAYGPGGSAGWIPLTGDWNGPESLGTPEGSTGGGDDPAEKPLVDSRLFVPTPQDFSASGKVSSLDPFEADLTDPNEAVADDDDQSDTPPSQIASLRLLDAFFGLWS
ncbi:MAG: hypothetical protein AB8B91_25110, partial [Rubripirellula sp.]